jgi:hypothetical protein
VVQPTPVATAFWQALRELTDRLHVDAVRHAAVRGVHRALTVVGLTAACVTAVAFLLAAMGAVSALQMDLVTVGSVGLAVDLVMSIAPWAAAVFHRPSLEGAAAWADVELFGDDRVASALELSRQPTPSPFARAAIRDGLDHVRSLGRRRPSPVPFPTRRLLAAAGSMCIAVAVWMATSQPRPGIAHGPRVALGEVVPRRFASLRPADHAAAQSESARSLGEHAGTDDRRVASGTRSPSAPVADARTSLATAVLDPHPRLDNPTERPATATDPDDAAAPGGAPAAGETPPADTAGAGPQGAATPPAADASPSSAGSSPPPGGGSGAPPPDSKGPPPEPRQTAGNPPTGPSRDAAPKQAGPSAPPGPADKANGKGQGGTGGAAKRSRGVAPLLLETRLPDVFAGRPRQDPSLRTVVPARPPSVADEPAGLQPPVVPGHELPVTSYEVPPESREQVGDYCQAYERIAASEPTGRPQPPND